jgi:hypothetical protein
MTHVIRTGILLQACQQPCLLLATGLLLVRMVTPAHCLVVPPREACEHAPAHGVVATRECMRKVRMQALHLTDEFLAAHASVAQGGDKALVLRLTVGAVVVG